MTIRNFLNLPGEKEIVIIEKNILTPRSFTYESLRVLFVILTVLGLTWGVSKAADVPLVRDILKNQNTAKEIQTISTQGQTSTLTDSTVLIFNANNQKGQLGFSYTVDFTNASFRSYTGETLSVLDLKTNQRIIAKGLLEDSTIIAHTIIIFGDLPPLEDVATSTEEFATTTEEIASTTLDVVEGDTAPNTEPATSTDTSTSITDSIIDTITDTIGGTIDSITDTIGGIIDNVTGTSTDPVDTNQPATSTEETLNNTATTTEDIIIEEDTPLIIEPTIPEEESIIEATIDESVESTLESEAPNTQSP